MHQRSAVEIKDLAVTKDYGHDDTQAKEGYNGPNGDFNGLHPRLWPLSGHERTQLSPSST